MAGVPVSRGKHSAVLDRAGNTRLFGANRVICSNARVRWTIGGRQGMADSGILSAATDLGKCRDFGPDALMGWATGAGLRPAVNQIMAKLLDAFVGKHCNSTDKPRGRGISTWKNGVSVPIRTTCALLTSAHLKQSAYLRNPVNRMSNLCLISTYDWHPYEHGNSPSDSRKRT